MSKNVIVIGAGPAGLTAAYKLSEKDFKVTVFEASPYVGGLSRTFDLWGQKVDIGPHRFFSSDKIVNDHWNDVVGREYSLVQRLTRIYYRNKFFHYPLQPANAFFNLGPVQVAVCILSYMKNKVLPPKKLDTFEEWVTSRFGKKLFSIFFKTYTEKVWGIPCSRIDADWAAQRIKKLSLFEAVKAAFFKGAGKKHKTLVDQFAYPTGGTGRVYEKMTDIIRSRGGKVELQQPVFEVLSEKQTNGSYRAVGVKLKDGTEHRADYVISTMPLTYMVKGLKHAPKPVIEACDRLYFRNTVLAYLEVDSAELFPDNWIYVHSPEVLHGRITNFRNWCPSLVNGKSTTILCMEFWCFEKDAIWSQDEAQISAQAESELRKIKLIPDSARVINKHVMKIPKSYPVYEIGYREPLEMVQEFVNSVDRLYAIGRYGAFKYNNQDHSILMGLLAAREIITGKKENLWDINTDSEYQEKATIEEAGFKESDKAPTPA